MKVLEFATCLVAVAVASMEPIEPRQDSWKTCNEDSDCLKDHSCLRFMWKDDYGDFGSEIGCFSDDQCAETATWNSKELATIQFFCNDEQIAKGTAMEPLTFAESIPKVWSESEFKQVCSEEEPCPVNFTCMSERSIYVWEGTVDTEWAVGHACITD